MKSIHNLVPFINKDNDFIITFPEYVKDYCNNNLYLDSYSFVSVIGKPGPTKFKVLNNLFSLDSTLNQEELQKQRINISQSHYASHFIHDVNLQGFDLYLEKEYKAVLFAFLTSTHIILILEQEDLKLLNIRKLLTILIMHYWATKDEGTHLKKLTFLVDSSNDVINYLANYESFMEDLKNTWLEVFKPPGMEQTSLYDVIELDFKSFTQHELENRPSTSKLLELSLSISSPTKKKASLLTAAISSLTSSVVSPFKSTDGLTSPTLQRTKKAPYPFELFQIYYDELWQSIKGTLTMPDLYDLNCAQRKNNLLEAEFKREKDEIYNKVEYEMLELRQRIENEYVVFDFQHVGMRIYDDAISKLLSLEYRSSLEYLFDGNDKLRNEKRLLAEKIVTELHELYQIQANYLKENVLSDLKGRMNFNKKRPEKEYGFKLATIFSREQEKLLHEVEETLNEFQVHIHEPGLTQKWETEPYLVEIKRSLKDFREKYLEEEVNKYLQNLVINTRRSLKQTVSLKNLDFDLWEEVQAIFISIVQENDENLSQFLEALANTKLMKATIKEKVFDFRKDCFEYILSLLREEVTEFGSTLFNNFETQFKEVCKKQESVWYSQGPSVAFDNLDQSSQAISKKILNRLDQLRYVQIEQEFFERTLDSLNYPRVFISEIKYNQLYKQFFDRVHIHVEAQKKKLRKKFKYDSRKQFRHEFIFWMVWILVLYFFFCYPGFTTFFLLLASAGVKGISYSGILKNLGLTNITAKVQQIYKESPIKSSATKLKKN